MNELCRDKEVDNFLFYNYFERTNWSFRHKSAIYTY